MAGIGIYHNILLYKIFAGISLLNSVGSLHYIFKRQLKAREWILAHLGNIFGAGIATYTAFFAFGGSRLFAQYLTGSLMVVPWILPSIIGIAASVVLTKKYRNKYRVC